MHRQVAVDGSSSLTQDSELEPEDDSCYPIRKYIDRNFLDTVKEMKIERNILDCFSQPSEGSVPCWDAEVIHRFCKKEVPLMGMSPPCSIYISDREHGTDKTRGQPKKLCVDQLRQALSVPRFGHPHLPDASRRQILIETLNTSALLTLVEMAPWHQVDTLREAFSKHISGGTSIKVQKQPDGLDKPHLEFHLPYLALRKASKRNNLASNTFPDHEPDPEDSLLVPEFLSPEGDLDGRYIIHKAQISVVVCVWDHTNWTTYAFRKLCPGSHSEHRDVLSTEGDDDGSDDEHEDDDNGEDPGPTEDIFAPDNGKLNLSSEYTIWNPRKYFLRIMAIWVDTICQEYTFLVQNLDTSLKAWRRGAMKSSQNSQSHHERHDSDTTMFNRTVETMQLLREVREHILPAIRAWASFHKTHLAFFEDLDDRDVKFASSHMEESFAELVELEQKLGFLDSFLSDSATVLKLRLTLESNDLNRHAHDLNMKNNLNSQDIIELNRTSTDAAIANVKAAEKTSWTTQINVLVIYITTPLILVLQYFGAERPIFSFERNTKSFVIAICIVFITLPALTFGIKYLDRVCTKEIEKRHSDKTSGNLGPHARPPIPEEA